jgi:hypothetical protein
VLHSSSVENPPVAVMSNRIIPDMSIVVLTPDTYETIRKVMQHLRAQTVRDRLEIIIVTPSADNLGPDESELEGFFQVRNVEVGEISSTARSRAAGIRQAAAPVVALSEDHSLPEPGWAEALIRAHEQPWAAVGPYVLNANPENVISIATDLMAGRPFEHVRAGVVDDLPLRNSSYKRRLLLEYGSELDALLEIETLLHWDLRARGYQLYLEPAARTYHQDFTRMVPFMREQLHVGRVFAAFRARRWSPLRRAIYTLGSPLIPLVRLRRILPKLLRPARGNHSLPILLALVITGLYVNAAGEMLGYASGAGKSSQRLCKVEFHRDQQEGRR